MYTFIEEEQILVTCDSFGAHYCLPEVVSSEIKNEADYQSALKYYYDCIIGPFFLQISARQHFSQYGFVLAVHTSRPWKTSL